MTSKSNIDIIKSGPILSVSFLDPKGLNVTKGADTNEEECWLMILENVLWCVLAKYLEQREFSCSSGSAQVHPYSQVDVLGFLLNPERTGHNWFPLLSFPCWISTPGTLPICPGLCYINVNTGFLASKKPLGLCEEEAGWQLTNQQGIWDQKHEDETRGGGQWLSVEGQGQRLGMVS